MPQVLVNPDSGLAETYPADIAAQKLQEGYHVPLHDTKGNSFSATREDASNLVASGEMRQPTETELNTWIEKGRFSTPLEQGKAFVRGTLKGIAGPLAPAAEHELLGTPYEEIQKNQKYNPGTTLGGEALGMGIGAAALPMASVAGIASKAGEAMAGGIALEGTFGNIAKTFVKGAVENELFAASHQIDESLLGNTKDTSENFLANMTMNAALGGGLSVAFRPISKALSGSIDSAALSAYDIFGKEMSPELTGAAKSISDAVGLFSFLKHPGATIAYKVGKTALNQIKEQFSEHFPGKEALLDAFLRVADSSRDISEKILENSGGLFGSGVSRILEENKKDEGLHELNSKVMDFSLNPEGLLDHSTNALGNIPEHMPGLTAAITETMGRAISYLNDQRPKMDKQAPLDMEKEPNVVQKAEFNRKAEIVNNPMAIFNRIKEGTLVPQHIEALATVYPSIYRQMQGAIQTKMVDFLSEHKPYEIPYQTRLAMSHFLGQNLDSSMTQPAIMNNQIALQSTAAQQSKKEAAQIKPSKSGMGKMKFVSGERTKFEQSQSRSKA